MECGNQRGVGRLVLPEERRSELVRDARRHRGHTERRRCGVDALSTAGSMSDSRGRDASTAEAVGAQLTTLMPMAPALASRGIVARVSDGTSRWLSTVGGAAELARARAAVMLTPNSNSEASRTSGSALKAADACASSSASHCGRQATQGGRVLTEGVHDDVAILDRLPHLRLRRCARAVQRRPCLRPRRHGRCWRRGGWLCLVVACAAVEEARRSLVRALGAVRAAALPRAPARNAIA